MLDLVKSIRFPTDEEVKRLYEMGGVAHSQNIMCAINGEPHRALGRFKEGYTDFQLIPGLYYPNVTFHPVLEIAPEYLPLADDSIHPMASVAVHGGGTTKYYNLEEPSRTNGMSAIRLTDMAYIISQPFPFTVAWVDAETCCGEILRMNYVFCPDCAALHRMPHTEEAHPIKTVVRCSECGREFVASRVSRVGIPFYDYQHLSPCSSDFVKSDGIELHMCNGRISKCLVNNWPAGTRKFNEYDIYSEYSQGTQTVKAMLNNIFGCGWDNVNEEMLGEMVTKEWGEEHVMPVFSFLHLWSKGQRSGIKTTY